MSSKTRTRGQALNLEEKDLYENKKIRNVASMDPSKRAHSSSSFAKSSKKKIVDDEVRISFEVIKINSKGSPQNRVLAFSDHYLYVMDSSSCKRKISLPLISRVSLSPHWDNVFCLHVDNEYDLLLVSPEKTEIVAHVDKMKKELLCPSVEICVTESFFFRALPEVERQVVFECPDGFRIGARVFVDIYDSNGVSLSKILRTVRPQSVVPPYIDDSVSISSLENDDENDDCSGDEHKTPSKKKGSTLLNRMMKIIPFKDDKNDKKESKFGEDQENYVFFKWMCSAALNYPLGRKVDSWQIQGNREYLEDAICVEYYLKMGGDLLIGCFDGHGGSQTSDWLAANMKFMVKKNSKNKDLNTCLIESFEECHKLVLGDKTNTSGSTALVVVFQGDKFTIANTGDCRALLIKTNGTKRLTTDHRFDEPEELERIKKMGGKVKDKRLHMPDGSHINVARSIGDRRYQPYIIPTPEIFEYSIQEDDEFLVIACDGLWDSLSDDLCRNITRSSRDPKRLCSLAYAMGSRDNLTAIIVHLKNHPPLEKAT